MTMAAETRGVRESFGAWGVGIFWGVVGRIRS